MSHLGLKTQGVLFTVLFLLALGCKHEQALERFTALADSLVEPNTEILETGIPMDHFRLIQCDILNDGDTNYYKRYKEYMFKGDYVERFLFWPLVMANKFDYPPAHLDVFNCILESYVCGDLKRINEIDPTTFDLMSYHLERAAKFKINEAMIISNEIDSIKYHGMDAYKGCDKYSDKNELMAIKGDTTAYKTLYIGNTELDFPPCHFLFWALFMANKYDYRMAYGHVYESLNDNNYYFNDDHGLDRRTAKMADSYLRKYESISVAEQDYYNGIQGWSFNRSNEE